MRTPGSGVNRPAGGVTLAAAGRGPGLDRRQAQRFKIAGQIVSICGCPVRRSQCQVHIPVADADRRGARRNPMAKFVYVCTGGQMAETPQAQEQAMQAWGAWFPTLGDCDRPSAGSDDPAIGRLLPRRDWIELFPPSAAAPAISAAAPAISPGWPWRSHRTSDKPAADEDGGG